MYIAIALTVITIAFFFIFRKQIIGLFPRVKSIGKGLIDLDSEQQKSKSEVDPQKEAESLMRQLDSVLIRETEDMIRGELGKKNLLGTEAVPVLIRYVAALSIAYSFLEIYRIIWGSQLNLLDYINSQNPQLPEALKVFYNSGAAQYPLIYSGYPFEQWLGFLKDQLLIREDKGLIGITVRGREFLTYLTTTGLTRNKVG